MARELALFKISVEGESRGQVMQYADIFRGQIVDVSKRSVTVEVTGSDDKIEAFEQLVRPFGLIEMVVFAVAVFVSFVYLISNGALDWGPAKRLPSGRTTESTVRRVSRPAA